MPAAVIYDYGCISFFDLTPPPLTQRQLYSAVDRQREKGLSSDAGIKHGAPAVTVTKRPAPSSTLNGSEDGPNQRKATSDPLPLSAHAIEEHVYQQANQQAPGSWIERTDARHRLEVEHRQEEIASSAGKRKHNKRKGKPTPPSEEAHEDLGSARRPPTSGTLWDANHPATIAVPTASSASVRYSSNQRTHILKLIDGDRPEATADNSVPRHGCPRTRVEGDKPHPGCSRGRAADGSDHQATCKLHSYR